MGTNFHDVYFCQENRTTELSQRMSDRNIPSHQIDKVILEDLLIHMPLFPMLDCHLPSSVNHGKFPTYDQHKMFNLIIRT